jgi:hypothetical protein
MNAIVYHEILIRIGLIQSESPDFDVPIHQSRDRVAVVSIVMDIGYGELLLCKVGDWRLESETFQLIEVNILQWPYVK